jgi:hypothetical protein
MGVIGFLRFTDFLEELSDYSPPEIVTVRVQEYHKSTVSSNLSPLEHYTFCVEAAFDDGVDVAVCRFITASLNVFASHDHEKLEKLEQRNRRAAEILRRRLKREGYTVAKGLIASAEESKVETSPDGGLCLWPNKELANDTDDGDPPGEKNQAD